MKLQNTITILLLCSTLVITAVADGECCTDCVAKLTNTGKPRKGEGSLPTVTTFTTPSTDFAVLAAEEKDTEQNAKVCGQYWTDNGGKTCCNQKELGIRIQHKKKRMTNRFHHMLQDIKKAHANKKNIAMAIETLKDATVQKSIIDKTAADADVENVTQTMIDDMIKMMEEIEAKKPEESNGEEEKKTANAQFKECAQMYGDSQVDFLCFDCSTKVLDFYDTATLKVSKEWCTKITKTCAGLFGISARNMALDNILRIMHNYMDDTATTKQKRPKSKKTVKTKADFEMLTACSADPAACAADDTKRQAFCSFLSLGNDNPAIFGDGGAGKQDITKIKGRQPKKGTRRLLMKLGMKIPKVINSILVVVEEDDTFVAENASGLKLELIKSGAEFLAGELPEGDAEEQNGSMMNSIVIVALMIGSLLF